jgi:two-component system heavy metal sensor histidine kinase CusS
MYALSAFGILLLSGVFLLRRLSVHLAQGRSQFLSDEIGTLRALQEEHPDSLDALRELEFESDASHFSHYYARVLEAGQPLVETAGMQKILPAEVFAAAPAPGSTAPRERTYSAPDGRHYLLATALSPLRAYPDRARVLQLGIDTTSGDALAAQYRKDVALAVLLGTLASTLAAWLLAKRGLRPLRDVADHARRITVTHLHERVSSTLWPAELTLLGTAFDEMLGRLEPSFAQLSQFSADLAHELRTPINNLMGEAEVALTRSRSAEEYRQVIESSMEEFGRLSRMIESLLFLARADKVETPLQIRVLDVRAELEAVREFYDALADEWEVQVSCHGQGELSAEPILFRRAVSNLLSNALNHTPKGGHVKLEVESAVDGLEVRVVDDGSGVAREHLPRLFERFYRVENAQRRAHGTGLGLALVKSILELHQGSVQLQSEAGRGMTVQLRFPLGSSATVHKIENGTPHLTAG